MRWLLAATLCLCGACLEGGGWGHDGPSFDHGYYCSEYAQAFCPAYAECDPFRFAQTFRSPSECPPQVEEDCLEPPPGIAPCLRATPAETDNCVAYLEFNHPDGCERLFGPLADMSPCEAICE
jgi:hypothetical protein